MKITIILLAITLTQCINWVHYNACDDRWKDIPSWISKVRRHRNDTICEIYDKTGWDADGWMLTAIASGISSYGRVCGDIGEECTPEVLNRILGDNYNRPAEVFRQWGVESNNKILRSDIEERLANGEVVVGVTKVFDGIKNAILVKEVVDENKITAINQFGEDVEYEYDQVEDNLVSFKLLNNKFMNFII